MKYYFVLQYRRMIRRLDELELHPVIALMMSITAFVGLSKFLFYKTEMASWLYSFFFISILLNVGTRERNDQLKTIFKKADYLAIRILENGLLLSPFLCYFFYEKEFLFPIVLIAVSIVFALITNLPQLQTTIPTPFRKFPFEFIVGFRKTAWYILLMYLLFGKALQVGNYNLGIFSLVVLFFITMSFYSKPEDEYYCWIFSMSPVAFLSKKILDGVICTSILTLPIFIAAIVSFPNNLWITIVAQLLGYVYLISMILAKYSAFPGVLNIAHAILYGISLLFPPLLIIIIPIFYIQAKRRLTTILGW